MNVKMTNLKDKFR